MKKKRTFTNKNITFSTECVRKFNNNQFVELLINPTKKLFAIRPSTKEFRTSVESADNLVIHSDRGVHYTNNVYQKRCFNMFNFKFVRHYLTNLLIIPQIFFQIPFVFIFK